MKESGTLHTQNLTKMQNKNYIKCKYYNRSDHNYSVMFTKFPYHVVPSTCSLPCSRSNSTVSGLSDPESSSEDEKLALLRKKSIDVSKLLPPIGVFWDIENCHVPKGKSATAVAQAIRDKFFVGYREADFVVVCDVTKEKSRIIQELNDAQVNLIHVAATCKNAADEKLRQSIRRFAEIYSAPAAIILISGDVNFAGDLNDLRHRKKIHVILVHNVNVSKALVLCASEHYSFSDLVENIPMRDPSENENSVYEIIVSNLPEEKEPLKIKSRLKHLCENSGGKIGFLSKTFCSIRFPAIEFAIRAKKRIDGEDVFGNKIIVSDPIETDDQDLHCRKNKKDYIKDDLDTLKSMNRRTKEDSTFQFNDFYSQNFLGNMENNLSHSQNLDPSFQQLLTKNIVPFFSNNISNFTFPKVPNIENLKVVQNTASHSQKSFLNNLESESSGEVDIMYKKNAMQSRKFNNVITNPMEGPNRLNNSAVNVDNDIQSSDNSQLFLAQSQQFHTFAQNAYIQRNMSQSILAYQMIPNQINRNNEGNISSSGRFIRGMHGNNNHNTSTGNRNFEYSEENDENFTLSDPYFEPIQKLPSENSNPVDLHVSGLDPHMDLITAKNLLTSVFKIHVEVLSVSVFCLTDGSVVASVKVPSFQDAQYAISKLQRRKIGVRRITISFQNSSRYQRQLIRSQVAQLLSEMPQNKTPLFRFTEMFKSRFLNSVSVSELNKMKDICIITEEESGRMISANSKSQLNAFTKYEKKDSSAPYCQLHFHKTLSDSEPPVLPTVKISLKLLTSQITALLESHAGKLFLPSLADCYQAQFGSLQEDSSGVPLEHLVSCISGVELSQGHGSFKYLTWSQASFQSNEDNAKCVSPMLFGTMSVFTRELLDLLKDTPKCLLPFSQFIPSYHRRYGRQCRVSDYGYTKLLDLLESLPHILQVMGNGTQKVVTLSHKAQIRRFTTDLLRVLKNQTNRQIDMNEFSAQYENVIGRAWDPCHYGLCELEDLLNCTPQSAVLMETKEDGRTIISIPKREQTPDEIEMTKKFALEVVELLKRVPNCSMEFNKFVPAYHNQFGRQCRVSSYGCFKLIELFESIPETVSIQEDSSRGEKFLVLTPAKKLQVLAERVCEILSAEGGVMSLFCLEFAYQFYQYESVVSPNDCECETFEEVLTKIPDYVKIEDSRKGKLVILKSEVDPVILTRRIRFILLNHEKLSINEFVKLYNQQYQQRIDMETDIIKVSEAVKLVKKGTDTNVQLTPLSVFANQMYLLLFDHNGRIPLFNFESAYLNKFKKPCLPSQFGFPTLSSLLAAIPETVTVQNSGYYTHKRIIALNLDLKNAGFSLPALNNGDSNQVSDFAGHEEKPLRSYDLWQSNSLFSCWNDLSSLPKNIKAPHPSELPLPSAKLSSPASKMLYSESGLRSEIGSRTKSNSDENTPGIPEVENCRFNHSDENINKRMNRIAAHFGNLI